MGHLFAIATVRAITTAWALAVTRRRPLGALLLAATLTACGRVEILEGQQQLNLTGAPVNLPPAVRVLGANSRPMADLPVTFQVTAGGGTLTGETTKTDQNGIARVGSWVLGAGQNTLTATVAHDMLSHNPITFTAEGGPSQFSVTLNYLSTLTTSQKRAFERAAARWSELIVGDLPDAMSGTLAAGACGANSPPLDNQPIDDLLIFVTVGPIDGPGQTLGTSGPCFVRQGSHLTVIGRMQFDSADLNALEFKGQLEPTVLHEMGHVLGYGSLWTNSNFLKNPSLPSSPGADTLFSGPRAQTAFDGVGGTSYTGGAKVPVENNMGGAGTRDGHWRESVFQAELMTGFLNDNVANPLSRVSVASLWDLGYQVNLSGADPYGLPVIGLRAEPASGIDLGDDLLRDPVRVIDPQGHVIEVRDP